MSSNILIKRLNEIQRDAVSRAVALLDTDGKCLVIMTTGSGKTHVGAKIIKRHQDKKILWLTQTDELIFQTRLDLQAAFGDGNVGLFQRKERNLSESITVASVQTITRDENLKSIPRDLFDLLIVDEAHHSRAITWEKVIKHFKCKKLGLTATPFRNDDRGLEDLFGASAFTLGYEEAKKLKIIASEEYRLVLTNSVLQGIVTNSQNYAPEALDRLVISENRNQIIAESYVKYARPFMKKRGLPYKAICFCISVKHAARMNQIFNDFGVQSQMIVGYGGSHTSVETKKLSSMRSTRKNIYEAFLEGTGAEIICVVNILNEGKNIPDVGCLMLARPTRSRTIFQQQIGRGCRRIEGVKEEFLVLDYVDMMNQKYPPMTMARISGKLYAPEDFILDYYKGRDRLVVDEIIHYLSPEFSFYPGDKWTKEVVTDELLAYYKKHGSVHMKDLYPTITGLPSRNSIKRFWSSIKECFEELGIPHRERNQSWTKKETEKALQAWFQKHGKIRIVDLGLKNNLPSQNTIYTYWGTWRKCEVALGFDSTEWKKKRIISAFRNFYSEHGRAPYHQDLRTKYGMPSIWPVQKEFGSLENAVRAAGNSVKRPKSGLPKGVWKMERAGRVMYRSEIYFEKKRYYLGDFESPEAAHAAYAQKTKELGRKITE